MVMTWRGVWEKRPFMKKQTPCLGLNTPLLFGGQKSGFWQKPDFLDSSLRFYNPDLFIRQPIQAIDDLVDEAVGGLDGGEERR